MPTAFDKAFEALIGHEGAFKCEKEDRMDWTGGQVGKGRLVGTKYGITAGTYPNVDIAALTLDEAKAIYKRDFWDVVGADQLAEGVGFQIFDAAVNHGVSRAIKIAQEAMSIPADGISGPLTKRTLAAMDPLKFTMRFLANRLRFMTQVSTWPKYGKGWALRIAGNLELGAK